MKGLELGVDHERRISRAQQLLLNAAGSLHSTAFVNVGDVIPVDHEAGFLRGHGTQPVNEQLLATVCGVVERVNRLVSVRPLRARYNAETGDVVVGRVTEVGGNRWKVDVNSRKDAELLLAAVNLPGGIQRRRTAIDELNMRDLYVENDLISAEVQSLHQDGSLHLHTRSLKYGKLGNGQLVKVAPYLIKRLKQHFHQLKDLGVDLILGCNGFIWIAGTSAPGQKDNKRSGSVVTSASAAEGESAVQFEVRERICRLANSVRVLGALGLLVSPESIIQTYEASLQFKVKVKDMLSADFYVKLAEKIAEQRTKR
ncbi:exosome complex component RRP4 homolog isoform X1 [Physcomitrium patens]|uniref:Uncharacterized protein n=1 Tax=Physcomitrium patens TaxID=3218 RepID=A0A2K1KWM7_PHYPA|nr:exosome complex component RRP4 homolog isoform X1 [Physcomitrium patens]PNR58183.1 hypothetical protein PHYPA_005178 [Physcomitrium patens]|eukprot:XP_024372197.1 exosome complex component RRP4 homolog isoform X1 [Physcomitrella patens]